MMIGSLTITVTTIDSQPAQVTADDVLDKIAPVTCDAGNKFGENGEVTIDVLPNIRIVLKDPNKR